MVERTVCFLYLLIISIRDMRVRRIPDSMTAGLLTTMVCMNIGESFYLIPRRFLYALFFLFLFYAVAAVSKGLGMGDVKLAAVLGYCAGFFMTAASLLLASIFGIIFGS